MGLMDLLKDIPLSAILKEKIAALDEEVASLKQENAFLKDENRKLKAENKRFKDEIQSLTHTDDLDETLIQLLIFLAEREGQMVNDSGLSSALKVDKARARYFAGELEKPGYISVDDHSGIITFYSLAHAGRKYLMDKGLI